MFDGLGSEPTLTVGSYDGVRLELTVGLEVMIG